MRCTVIGGGCKIPVAAHPVASQGTQQEYMIVILTMQPSWIVVETTIVYSLTFDICWGQAVTID